MADYHLTNNRSPPLSPTLPLPPPFQRHLNNSNSTTPSPAPPQQPLQQPSPSSSQIANIATVNSGQDVLLGHRTSTSTANANRSPLTTAANTTTFDYLYEFSETRKVLEDFFKCPNTDDDKKITDCFNESDTGSFVSPSLSPAIMLATHTKN